MAPNPVKMALSQHEIVAGRDYLTALRRLKFEPEAMCWITMWHRNEDGEIGEFAGNNLAIVSGLADFASPRAVYDLLFKAYDASATPKSVDPFNVTIYGSGTSVGETLLQKLSQGLVDRGLIEANADANANGSALVMNNANLDGTVVSAYAEGVYVVSKARKDRVQNERRFASFKRQVDRLTAH